MENNDLHNDTVTFSPTAQQLDIDEAVSTEIDSSCIDIEEKEQEQESVYCGISYLENILFVPAMIACSDIITGLASGMTVKFFPIFFTYVLKLDPVQVQMIYLLNI